MVEAIVDFIEAFAFYFILRARSANRNPSPIAYILAWSLVMKPVAIQ